MLIVLPDDTAGRGRRGLRWIEYHGVGKALEAGCARVVVRRAGDGVWRLARRVARLGRRRTGVGERRHDLLSRRQWSAVDEWFGVLLWLSADGTGIHTQHRGKHGDDANTCNNR